MGRVNFIHKADFTNININGRRSGDSSDINSTSRNSNSVANYSIISDPLSGRGSQQRREDLVRDSVVILNSNNGDQELPEPGVSEVEDTAKLASDNQNNNINDGSSSNIMANDDSIMTTTEQTVPTEGQYLPTTMKPAES